MRAPGSRAGPFFGGQSDDSMPPPGNGVRVKDWPPGALGSAAETGWIGRAADQRLLFLRFELCLVNSKPGRGSVSAGRLGRRATAMTDDSPPRVGDRVNVDGRAGLFFVLHVDIETRSTSLLPSDNRPIPTRSLWKP
jgi:hypothetical protein